MASILLTAAGTALGGPIGGAIGSVLGSMIDARIVAGLTPDRQVEGARLDTLRITSATEGAVIPRVYGRMRVGGNIIWATDFREVIEKTRQGGGGKGGGGPKVTTTTYRFHASFAVAVAEGPIGGIGRIWADGKPFDVPGAIWRVHSGREDQLPDPHIEAKMGTGNAPAYRGTAYVVFEDLPLERFGNRLPQLSFEVVRPSPDPTSAEQLLRAVNIIPSAGEFVYATETITRKGAGGVTLPENQNSTLGVPDIVAALDDLAMVAPHVESAALVVSWFGTDLRAGACQIMPGVEVAAKATHPKAWAVNGVTRADARVVSTLGGNPAFGGTPADFAVVQAIAALRARAKRVTFYPFLLMDVPAGNTLPDPYSDGAAAMGQPAFPWRGRITCAPAPGFAGTTDKTEAAAAQVAAFFGSATAADFAVSGTSVIWTGSGSDWGFRRMILHYAHLCAAAGGVDAFLIGSELRGLTQIRSAAGTYPAVAALKTLAADCRAILGAGTKISYAADWSEYFGHHPQDSSGDVYFHLDPLWADTAIDFIGIDNYMPLSDWRDGSAHVDALASWASVHDLGYLKSNIAGGEGFDWFYASDADRVAQIRTPISDGAYGKAWVFRTKDLRAWWTNPHHDRPGGVESASPTTWLPQSKPIRFTEAGCPAIDKGSNQPNLFFDPKSSESAFPYFSTGARDDLIQRRTIEALHLWWNDAGHNPSSGLYPGRMLDTSEIALWTWDARPFPAFPGRADVWGDAANWQLGHWLSGRLGAASLADLIRELCLRSGIPAGFLDTSALADAVPGFAVAALESPRSSIEPLARYFGFDMVESQGVLRFVPRGRAAVANVTADELVVAEAGQSEDITFTRAQETELPRVLKWRLLSPDEAYDTLTVEARRIIVDTARIRAEQFPIAHPAELADRNARRALLEEWVGREEAAFALPPSRIALDPTDVVRIAHDGRAQDFALVRIADGEARRIEARRTDPSVYGLPIGPTRPPVAAKPTVFGPPEVAFLDLPQLTEDAPAHRPYAAAFASPWYGSAVVWRSATLDGFEAFALLDQPGRFGTLAAALPPGPVWRFDKANAVLIDVVGSGAFASVTDDQLLAGANALAVESAAGVWEVMQFASAELIGTGRWRLSRLLRGQLGTEDAIGVPAPVGARVVVLDASVKPLAIGEAEVGLPWNWRVGPGDRGAGDPLTIGLAFTPAGRGLRPWSPVQLKCALQPGGDLGLSWIRRTRALSGDSWVLSEAALGEASESYDLEILSADTVVRTVPGLTAPAFTYTTAMMVADFGAPVATVRFRVFQIGALGRGAAGELPA